MDVEKTSSPAEKNPTKPNDSGEDSTDVDHGHLVELEVDLAAVLEGDVIEGDYDANTSPFAEVRSVVPEIDDMSMPINTFRAWFLGIVSFNIRGEQLAQQNLIYHNSYSSLLALESTSSSPSGE